MLVFTLQRPCDKATPYDDKKLTTTQERQTTKTVQEAGHKPWGA